MRTPMKHAVTMAMIPMNFTPEVPDLEGEHKSEDSVGS